MTQLWASVCNSSLLLYRTCSCTFSVFLLHQPLFFFCVHSFFIIYSSLFFQFFFSKFYSFFDLISIFYLFFFFLYFSIFIFFKMLIIFLSFFFLTLLLVLCFLLFHLNLHLLLLRYYIIYVIYMYMYISTSTYINIFIYSDIYILQCVTVAVCVICSIYSSTVLNLISFVPAWHNVPKTDLTAFYQTSLSQVWLITVISCRCPEQSFTVSSSLQHWKLRLLFWNADVHIRLLSVYCEMLQKWCWRDEIISVLTWKHTGEYTQTAKITA